jgi:predicted Zn-dependent protease
LKSYPFHSPAALNWGIVVVFIVLALGILKVMVEMEKDDILSALANTEAGKLSSDFYIRVIYGALPLFKVIASQFPSVAQFFFSWVQPSLQAFK